MNPKLKVFQEEAGFSKLFRLFKEKYRSLGRIGGNVCLQSFSQEEIDSIAGFLGLPSVTVQQKGSLALLDFEKELSNTGFKDYTLLQLMEEVLEETIYTKKEDLEYKQTQEYKFLEQVKQAIPGAGWWIEWIAKKPSESRWFWSYFQQNKEDLFEKIIVAFKAFTSLPKQGEVERLPFFSQRTTGNPHYFDHNEIPEKLLLQFMYVDQLSKGNKDACLPRRVEELNDLLAEYGIMRDDLWNFVTCQGLLAAKGDEFHPVWNAAVSSQTVLNIPMKELPNVDRIWPAIGNKVWVVENSSVCSTIMDAVPKAPVICTHGQLRMASWHVLDKLIESNYILYYSGDIDPEGIIIADKLLKRYREHVYLWRMDSESYKNSLSNEDITDRLSKLDSISTSSEWNGLISMMRDVKRAGYQEGIVSKLIEDIKQNL